MNASVLIPASRSSASGNSRARSTGFTLLELVVVITMIAILAAVLLPRLTGQPQRAAEAEAIAVQRLLSAAAERSTLAGGQRLAIEYSTIDGVSKLAVVSRDEQSSAQPTRRGSASPGRSGAAWKQEPLIEPVEFTHLDVKQATLDGRRLDARSWLAPLGASQVRPTIALVLEPRGKATSTAYRIDLLPDSVAALRSAVALDQLGVSGSRALSGGPLSRSIDLDATGRGDSPW